MVNLVMALLLKSWGYARSSGSIRILRKFQKHIRCVMLSSTPHSVLDTPLRVELVRRRDIRDRGEIYEVFSTSSISRKTCSSLKRCMSFRAAVVVSGLSEPGSILSTCIYSIRTYVDMKLIKGSSNIPRECRIRISSILDGRDP
jgi:hypothetical protein